MGIYLFETENPSCFGTCHGNRAEDAFRVIAVQSNAAGAMIVDQDGLAIIGQKLFSSGCFAQPAPD